VECGGWGCSSWSGTRKMEYEREKEFCERKKKTLRVSRRGGSGSAQGIIKRLEPFPAFQKYFPQLHIELITAKNVSRDKNSTFPGFSKLHIGRITAKQRFPRQNWNVSGVFADRIGTSRFSICTYTSTFTMASLSSALSFLTTD
jgi:hypothetical protein